MNKKNLKIALVSLAVMFVFTLPAMCFAQSGHGHNAHQGQHESAAQGKLIQESHVDGYHLTYRLIDMRERMKSMNMEGMSATHHLMMHIVDADGNPVSSAKVGFLVKGAHGDAQKVMAMEMGESFGSDIELNGSGSYEIYTKALVGGRKLMDRFTYTVE